MTQIYIFSKIIYLMNQNPLLLPINRSDYLEDQSSWIKPKSDPKAEEKAMKLSKFNEYPVFT